MRAERDQVSQAGGGRCAMYEINGQVCRADDPALAGALQAAYAQQQRPLCLCLRPGLEMYIARLGERFIVKRMPDSGYRHATSCDSFEPPPHMSGIGELIGAAIQANAADGVTTLKLDFAMSKSGVRPLAASAGTGPGSVRTDGKRLTLRALLHYLLDEAALTRWSPAMEGKRNWHVIRKYLLQAAAGKQVKGKPLADQLYLPEPFSVEHKDEIAGRRRVVFDQLAKSAGGARRLMLLIAEVNDLGDARFGKKLRVKHMPDAPFLLADDLYQRVLRRFETEMLLWSAVESSHLLVAATFRVGAAGWASIEEMTLMLTDEHWLCIDSSDDMRLLEALVGARRRFHRTLRYNVPSAAPLATAVLTDASDPVALYVVPSGADERYQHSLYGFISKSSCGAWTWTAGTSMPDFPALR